MDVFPRVIEEQDDLDISETIFPRKISRRVELPEVMSQLTVRRPFARTRVVLPGFEIM